MYKSPLRIVDKDRRLRSRDLPQSAESLVNLQFCGSAKLSARWVGLAFTRLTFSVAISATGPEDWQLEKTGDLRILDQRSELQVLGQWTLIHKRVQGDAWILAFALYGHELLGPLEQYVPPQTLLKPSFFRLLLNHESRDKEELSALFTSIKDFPGKLPVRLFQGEKVALEGHFDFSSEARELRILEIQVDPLKVNWPRHLVLEFVLHATRYLTPVKVEAYDEMFSILGVSLPQAMLAITTRKHQRWPCVLPVHVRSQEWGVKAATIVSLSPSGALLKFDEEVDMAFGTEVFVDIARLGITLFAQIREIQGSRIGLSFNPELSPGVFALFSEVVSDRYIVRVPAHYEYFLNLYRAVGYGPCFGESEADWAEKNIRAWDLQDKLLPGNTLGILESELLHAASGNIPIGEDTITMHSLAMRHTLESLNGLCDGNAYNLAWTEFLDGVKYFGGSARSKSRLSTRLYRSFQSGTGPSQAIDAACAALREWPKTPTGDARISFKACEQLESEYPAQSVHLSFIQRVKSAHPKLQSVHQVDSHLITFEGKTIGLVVRHSSPAYFTAADLMNLCYVFFEPLDIDPRIVIESILAEESLKKPELDIFFSHPNELQEFLGQGLGEEVLWYFVEKDEMGPLLSSVSRVALSVFKKYGEEAVHGLARKFF